MPNPPTSGQVKVPHPQGLEGAPKSPKLGTEVASTDVSIKTTVGSSPHSGRTMVEDVKTPQTKGWAPWPTALHAAKEEKKKKEEEERKKKKEEERGRGKGASPPPGLLEEGAPTLSPQRQQQ